MSDSEEITPLPLVSEVDRVIDEENTKTFKVKAVLHYLDDKGGERFEGCGVSFDNPVPVLDGEGKPLGAATLSLEGKVLVAELFLRYDSPERLSIETKSDQLYASWSGNTTMDNSDKSWRIVHAHVTEVVIDSDPPIDERLEAL